MNDHLSTDMQSALLDDHLPAEVRERALAHLADCAECRAEYDALQAVVELVRAAPLRPMPEGADLRLSPAMLAAAAEPPRSNEPHRQSQGSRNWLSWLGLPRPGAFALGGAAVAAVATLAVGVGFGLMSPLGGADSGPMADSAAILTEGAAPAADAVPQREPALREDIGRTNRIAMAEVEEDAADAGESANDEAAEYELAEEVDAGAATDAMMANVEAEEWEAEAAAEDGEASDDAEAEPVAQPAYSAEPSEVLRDRADTGHDGIDDLSAAPSSAAPPASGPSGVLPGLSGLIGLASLVGIVLGLILVGFLALRQRN